MLTTQKHHYRPKNLKPPLVKPPLIEAAEAPIVKPEKHQRIHVECSIDAEGNYHFSPGEQTISACTVEWLRKKNGIPKSDTEKIKKLVILRYIYVYLRHPMYPVPTRSAGSEKQQIQQSIEA